jgi:hypothetical protein
MKPTLIPALLLAAVSFTLVAAAEPNGSTCVTTCASCAQTMKLRNTDATVNRTDKASYAKGYIAPRATRTETAVPATSRANHPGHIGPKGGDIRKGHALVARDLASAATPAFIDRGCTTDGPAIGPKGGYLTTKGMSQEVVLQQADAACLEACSGK